MRLFLMLTSLLVGAAHAQEGPSLGVASNFEQGWFPKKLEMSKLLPVLDFRDAIRWRGVEREDGTYVFDGPMTTYPLAMAELGAGMSLTVDSSHQTYDNGFTPVSPEGQAAFARFAAAAVLQFPNVHSLEVGNEMNSATFAKGPGWEGDIRLRAHTYAGLLKATAQAVREVRPEVRILGGAAHSIPLPWFEEIFAQGGADYMDAIVLHPYAVQPEMLRRTIALLRALPEAAEMPIEITEWGSLPDQDAPAHLMKGYCQFALSGVTRFIWYPLGDRGDGLIPLLGEETLTDAGRAYQLAQNEFWGKPATDLGVDPFTYGCGFGDRAMVLWGAPRQVTLAEGVRAYASDAQPLDTAGLQLNRDHPIVLLSDTPIRLGQEVSLGPHGVIADSFDQFAFQGSGQARGPFSYLAETDSQMTPYATRPGQERAGVPWSPYLASDIDWRLRAGEDWVIPRNVFSYLDEQPVSVVLRYRALKAEPARLHIEIAPGQSSLDGVILQVRQRREILFEKPITSAETIELDVSLVQGLDTDVVVSPGLTDTGDFTRLRVRFDLVE